MFRKFLLLSYVFLCINLQSKGIFQDKMKKMVKEFENIYKINPDLKEPVNIAVFSFNCDKKLQSKGIGNALREILTHYILYEGKFKVIEREELEKVFDEWKLSLSGAIEEETAIKVGKMLGVKFIIIGNISKIGKDYQITSKMIDAETGEVVISSFTDVDAKTFDEEAKPYLQLVPETQAIGLYFSGMLPDFSNSEFLSPDTIQGMFIDTSGSHKDTVDYTFIIKPQNPLRVREISFGGGIKYFPFKWLMADIGIIFKSIDLIKEADDGEFFQCDIYYRFEGDTLRQVPFEYSNDKNLYSSLGIKIGINLPFYITKFIKIYPGVEIEWYLIEPVTSIDILPEIHYNGTDFWIDANTGTGMEYEQNIFSLKLGIELRPQQRIGLSLNGKYRFYHHYTRYFSVYGLYQDNIDGGNMIPFNITDNINYIKFAGDTYTINFSLSLYF